MVATRAEKCRSWTLDQLNECRAAEGLPALSDEQAARMDPHELREELWERLARRSRATKATASGVSDMVEMGDRQDPWWKRD